MNPVVDYIFVISGKLLYFIFSSPFQYFEPLVPYLFVGIPLFLMFSVVSFIILTAVSGSVEYLDTFKEDKQPLKYYDNYRNQQPWNESNQRRRKRSGFYNLHKSWSFVVFIVFFNMELDIVRIKLMWLIKCSVKYKKR